MKPNLNKHNFKIGDKTLLDGKEAVLLDFIDELTCEVEVDFETCYTRPKKTSLNKFYNFIGWPQDIEIIHDTYRRTILCSIYNLKPFISPNSVLY